jgi:hypothetical protein
MVLTIAVLVVLVALMRFNLTALPEPGHLEARVANRAKRFLIHRASRKGIPLCPLDAKASVENGGTHYGLDCSICHGTDGRS